MGLPYVQNGELVDGENAPDSRPDVLNRPLKQFLVDLANGDIEGGIASLVLSSATFTKEGTIVTDDIVYYNTNTNRLEKASTQENILGIIDLTRDIITVQGTYQFTNRNDLQIGERYFSDGINPGNIVVSSANDVTDIFVGTATDSDKISVNLQKVLSDSIINAQFDDNQISITTGWSSSKIASEIGNSYTRTELNNGQLDNRYYTETEIDNNNYTKTELNNGQLDNRYYTETEIEGGQLDNRYYTETELNNGQLDNLYYTKTELNNGQLDNRYYTETEIDNNNYTKTELNNGQLDNRYYTETEIDATIADLGVSVTQVASTTNTNSNSITISDSALRFTNSFFNYTTGINEDGYILTSRDVTKVVDTSAVSDGIKWVSENLDGSNSFYSVKPSYGTYEKQSVDDNRPSYIDGVWTSTSGDTIVNNGTFDTNITGWTGGSWNSGRLMIDSDLTSHQVLTCEIGKKYRVHYDFVFNNDTSRQAFINIGSTGVNSLDLFDGNTQQQHFSDYGTYIAEFVATSTTIDLTINYNYDSSPDYALFDNIIAYDVEPTVGTVILPTPSFMQNPVSFVATVPQSIDINQELEINYMNNTYIRKLKLGNALNIESLETVDPFIVGEVWNNSGVLTISSGV